MAAFINVEKKSNANTCAGPSLPSSLDANATIVGEEKKAKINPIVNDESTKDWLHSLGFNVSNSAGTSGIAAGNKDKDVASE